MNSKHFYHSLFSLEEEGSISVMVAFLLPVLILLLALIVNINQLFFAKIKLQNTVDACALSAATVQAVGLNEIADLNTNMYREYKNLIRQFRPPYFKSPMHGRRTVRHFMNGFSGVLDNINKYQRTANRYFAGRALFTAYDVQKKNFPGTILQPVNPRTKLATFRLVRRRHTWKAFTMHNPTPYAWIPVRIYNSFIYLPTFMKAPHQFRSIWWMAKRMPPFYYGFPRVPMYYKRNSGSKTYSHFKLHLPLRSFIMGKSIFGYTPYLTAEAKAIPAGGYNFKGIRGIPKYQAVLVK